MIVSPNEKWMNLQMKSALAFNKKLRRLTTTEVLTFYLTIFKNCADNFKEYARIFIKLQTSLLNPRLALYSFKCLYSVKCLLFFNLSEQADNAYNILYFIVSTVWMHDYIKANTSAIRFFLSKPGFPKLFFQKTLFKKIKKVMAPSTKIIQKSTIEIP